MGPEIGDASLACLDLQVIRTWFSIDAPVDSQSMRLSAYRFAASLPQPARMTRMASTSAKPTGNH